LKGTIVLKVMQIEEIRDNVRYSTDTPILTYCRQLISEDSHPHTELHVHRGDMLAIKVRAIGEGAKLTVQADKYYGSPIFVEYVPKNRVVLPTAGLVHSLNSASGTMSTLEQLAPA
jgi:hypothetical protein